ERARPLAGVRAGWRLARGPVHARRIPGHGHRARLCARRRRRQSRRRTGAPLRAGAMNEHQDRDERGVNRMLRRLFLAALVGGAAGCASGDATEHPQIRHAVKPAVLLDTTAAASPAAAASAQALLAFRSRVASARVATTIGSADGPSYAVFGRIADVALDGGGRIYVLDGFADEIRQFEPDGEFRRSFGGRGDGPTE